MAGGPVDNSPADILCKDICSAQSLPHFHDFYAPSAHKPGISLARRPKKQ
jgi:hypothetical protein